MNTFDISEYFSDQIKDDKSPAIAAMMALMESMRQDKSTTLQEFIEKMNLEREKLSKVDVSIVSVSSGSELFMRFITLAHRELEQAADFSSCREILLRRGEKFVKNMQESRKKILRSSTNLIKDGMIILTHSHSRNVLAVMTEAVKQGRQFSVFVTESQPDNSGRCMAKALEAVGIPCTVILDAAVGYIMERVNAVMLGAEGVCENGGIINKIGSCNVATLAHMKNKPVYVLVESYKFIRRIPLDNSSLPKSYLHKASVLNYGSNLELEHPQVDYTHPDNLTLLYTDLGVLPTSAVTEHLIKLYT
ncbi:translation initiation factor eIF-2B subunit alpha-like isoform X1 [Portunus trituberculatus]|uniref:Translation initiation factor eIF2B subunit alpha n=2 Tax=Portunus trituberculatus TaxID=210409 RepID=A0A5B7E6H0_PORTR|nr:translation initiation factor eIF-2B subunit alpha-like isoform X1 [Portunus trituberculatus]MPC29388.1 Translation initiation factor eIF-2B subunit alpha [Portunus trituberculatus]